MNPIKGELLLLLDDANRVAQLLRRDGLVEAADAVAGYARGMVQTIERGGLNLDSAADHAALRPVVENSLRGLGLLFQKSLDGDEVEAAKASVTARGLLLLQALS